MPGKVWDQYLLDAYAVVVVVLPAFVVLELLRPGSVTSVFDLRLVVLALVFAGLLLAPSSRPQVGMPLSFAAIVLASLGVGGILWVSIGPAWGVAGSMVMAALGWTIKDLIHDHD